MSLTPVLSPWAKGCTCPVIEYSDGTMLAVAEPQCRVHGKMFPGAAPTLTEEEKYKRAFAEAEEKPQ
jgi:hypothetical protein